MAGVRLGEITHFRAGWRVGAAGGRAAGWYRLFAGEGPAHHGRLFRNDGQVRARRRVRLAAALLPLLQGSFADAVGARELSLRHFHPPADGPHVDRFRPDLLQFDFAAMVREDQLHSLSFGRVPCRETGDLCGADQLPWKDVHAVEQGLSRS